MPRTPPAPLGTMDYIHELEMDAMRMEVEEEYARRVERSQRDRTAIVKQCADRWIVTDANARPVLARCA